MKRDLARALLVLLLASCTALFGYASLDERAWHQPVLATNAGFLSLALMVVMYVATVLTIYPPINQETDFDA